MKKFYIPFSFTWNLLRLLVLSFTIVSIISFIYSIESKYEIIISIIILLLAIFFAFSSFRLLFCFGIILNKEGLKAIGDLLPKFEKIQYKCVIKYEDIKDIKIEASNKNSNGKSINNSFENNVIPKKYLVFQLDDGKEERICINHYTRKQIIKLCKLIIEFINQKKVENIITIDRIMKNWYSYGNYSKIKKH